MIATAVLLNKKGEKIQDEERCWTCSNFMTIDLTPENIDSIELNMEKKAKQVIQDKFKEMDMMGDYPVKKRVWYCYFRRRPITSYHYAERMVSPCCQDRKRKISRLNPEHII